MKPTPRRASGKWVIDLRWAGFGQRYTLGPEALPEVEAIHQAYALLNKLRATAPPPVQHVLPATSGKRHLASIAAEFSREKQCATEGGRAWFDQVLKHVVREMGSVPIGEFAPPAGARALRWYRDLCRCVCSATATVHAPPCRVRGRREMQGTGLGLGPRTTADRLSIVSQVLRYACEQGELPALPMFPRAQHEGERLYVPRFEWIDEATFRQLRGEMFTHARTHSLGTMLARSGYKAGDVDDYIARRQLYASFAFYTGMHTADLDAIDDSWAAVSAATYLRRNTKSAAHVEDRWQEMPGPLLADIKVEIRRLGRYWFPGELICGGPWGKVHQVMTTAARDVGLKLSVNPRLMRRSFVRELALRGYTEAEVVDLMGHVDAKMVRGVYLRLPAIPSVRSRWIAGTFVVPPEPAQVIEFPSSGGVR